MSGREPSWGVKSNTGVGQRSAWLLLVLVLPLLPTALCLQAFSVAAFRTTWSPPR